jgi:4-hydroxyphenylpyruvate dioxygenase
MGTDGFEFIEYAAPDPPAMADVFARMGFKAIARHRHKNVSLCRQGEINFILNAEPDSFAQRFARLHGPSVCAIAFRVHDAKAAYERAVSLGAWGYAGTAGPGELNIPAIKGIGDSLIYLVDRWRGKDGAKDGDIANIGFFDVDFRPLPGAELNPVGNGLQYIDHLTHNVHRGRMAEWADFYERLFNFREIRYFDIEGKLTGLKSKAMTSPCGKIRIPINESQDDKSQIEEYLREYRGEGIQHIALGTNEIYATVDALRGDGVEFQDTPDTYYEAVDARADVFSLGCLMFHCMVGRPPFSGDHVAAVLTKVPVVMRSGKELRFESDQERTVQPGRPEESFPGRLGLNRTACPVEQRQ